MDTPEVQQITVRDRLGPVSFQGHILADCRWGRSDKPRWTDMVLYKIDNDDALRSSGVFVEVLLNEFTEELSDRDPFFKLRPHQRDALNDMMSRTLQHVVTLQQKYRYALVITARSYVYHRPGSPCVKRRQRFTTAGEVRSSNHRWRWLVPCRKAACRPKQLEYLNDSDQIVEEQDKNQLFICTSASDILARLYQRSGEISDLSAKLLIQAADSDPDISGALRSTRTVYPGIIEAMDRVQAV